MKVKGPVACLLATLISVLATVTVAADTDTDSSATAAHGLRVSKAKEENRALQDLPQLSELRQELKTLNGEAKAAALAVKKKRTQVDRAKFRLDTKTVWEECPRFGPTAEQSCDPDTLTSKCHYGKKCEDVDGMCKRRRHCECVAGKFSCTKQEGTCIPCGPLTKKKCEALLNCDLEGNRGIPVEILEDGPSLRDLTAGGGIPRDNNIKYGKVVGCWDVSQMTNMDYGFWQRRGFNQPLCWDVSKVTSMTDMFYDARFDQDISFWDVSSVTNLDKNMFRLNTLDPDDVRAYFNLEDDDEDEDEDTIPSSVVTTIYTEDFNSINAPLGHFNGGPNGQSTARHDLVYGADLMTGWTKSSSFRNDIHCVDTANTWSGGVVSTNPQNWGIMIYATTIITQSDEIVGSNTIGTQYSIDFLAAGAVYQITSQVNNGSNDKLLVEVLRALDNAVLHSFNHIPAAPVGVGNLGLLPVSFAYTGDGSGNIKFRIGSGNPGQGRFQGTIDDLSLSRLSN